MLCCKKLMKMATSNFLHPHFICQVGFLIIAKVQRAYNGWSIPESNGHLPVSLMDKLNFPPTFLAVTRISYLSDITCSEKKYPNS